MTSPDPLDAALLAAWNAAEPAGPECHLCGSATGPWLPDPSGDRWPSGAQKLICSRRCRDEMPTTDADVAAKDTRAPGESTLSSDVRDLLTAIRDALDIPLPAISAPAGEAAYRRLVAARAAEVRLAAVVAVKLAAPHLPVLTESVRSGIDRLPVDYSVYERGEG